MTPTNLPASIRARLRNLAERDRIDFGAIGPVRLNWDAAKVFGVGAGLRS